MVDGASFLAEALDLGIGLFCGVPDSLLREFVACVDDLEDRAINVVVANEGAGVALAAGHHLATGGVPGAASGHVAAPGVTPTG